MYAFASLAAAPAGSRPPLPLATLDTGFTRPDDDGDVEEGAEDAMLTKERDREGRVCVSVGGAVEVVALVEVFAH